MANETYKPISSVQIDGFAHSQIQGTPVDSSGPFKNDIPQFSCVGVDEVDVSGSNLRKISPIHGRSYEFRVGEETTLFWSDEYGNIFTKITTKGNNLTYPNVFRNENSPSGFLLYGMQESDSIVRVLKASDLLRAAGVETETIIRLIEPGEIPVAEEKVSLVEFKSRLIRKVWDDNASEGDIDSISGDLRVTRDEIPALSIALSEMTLLITIRGLQTSERLADLRFAKGNDIGVMLNNAFKYVNLNEKLHAVKDFSYTPQFFSTDSEEDVCRYLTEYLPRRMAINLAKMHSLGLVHVFPHSGNISTIGSFYDLDSVKGEPLGMEDSPITDQDKFNDIHHALFSEPGFPPTSEIIGRLIGYRVNLFNQNFIQQYIKETGNQDNSVRLLSSMFELESGIFALAQGVAEMEYLPASEYLFDMTKKTVEDYLDLVGKVGLWMPEDSIKKTIMTLFRVTIEDFVSLEAENKLFEQLEEITTNRGPALHAFARTFARRETKKMIPYIVKSLGISEEEATANINIDDPTKAFDEMKVNLYSKLIKDLGWEDNITAHIEDVDYLFGGFGLTSESMRYQFDYYRAKLVEQLGWDFTMSQSRRDMIRKFHINDQNLAMAHMDNAVRDNDGEDPIELIDNALTTANGDGINFEFDAFARYTDFVYYFLRKEFDGNHFEQSLELYEKYGIIASRTIYIWLEKKYSHIYVDDITWEETQKLQKNAARRIKRLKNNYYAKFSSEVSSTL